jgi:hypothetical protein
VARFEADDLNRNILKIIFGAENSDEPQSS